MAIALLAGGGMPCGQVIGSTNRLGGEADSGLVTFPEVIATLYRNLGIDINSATVNDNQSRPRHLVDDNAQPLKELP